MYDYDYVKPKYKEKAELFYKNTDSLKGQAKITNLCRSCYGVKIQLPTKKKDRGDEG